MQYVYILRSLSHQGQRYIGITTDLKRRLADHNNGKSLHTSQFRPWGIETYLGFSDQKKAEKFERYLKHGSGWAFAKKHF